VTEPQSTEPVSQRFQISRDVAYRTVGDKVVIVVPRENRLLTLNGTAAEVWNRLDGRDIRELVTELETIFDVNAETLERDVVAFVDQMVERQLVIPVRSGGPP
jgi:Coenzyme PQQ synthesis protein D (PqqD)